MLLGQTVNLFSNVCLCIRSRGVQKVRRQKILCLFVNSFRIQFRKKQKSLGARTTHLITGLVSSSTGCHPKCRLWTTPSPTVFAIRIARQMAGWKTRNNHSSTTILLYHGIRALKKRWTKCISVAADYVEKW